MSEIQHPPVTAHNTNNARLDQLYASALTDNELRRMAALTSPHALPQEWLIEIARRFLKTY